MRKILLFRAGSPKKSEILWTNCRKGTSSQHDALMEPSMAMIGRSGLCEWWGEKLKKWYEEKSQKGKKSPYCRDAPAGRILIKFGKGADPDDVVTCVKFDDNRFGSLNFGGSMLHYGAACNMQMQYNLPKAYAMLHATLYNYAMKSWNKNHSRGAWMWSK